jgi:hypothetical protein
VGIYSFPVLLPPKNDDSLEKNCQVLVFDHLRQAYEDFVLDLPVLFSTAGVPDEEHPDEEELDLLVSRVVDEYFVGRTGPVGHREDDIRDILRYYAETEDRPVFLEFEDRDKCDLAKEARRIYDEGIGGIARTNYEDRLWNDKGSFWQVLFNGRKDIFIRQLSIEYEKAARPPTNPPKVIPPDIQEEQKEYADLSLWELRKVNPAYWRRLTDELYKRATDAEGFIHSALSGFKSKHKILFQIDHKVPMEHGGKTVLDNLQVLTRWENINKGGKQDYLSDPGTPIFPKPGSEFPKGQCKECSRPGSSVVWGSLLCDEHAAEYKDRVW